jgi:hypothetical protein
LIESPVIDVAVWRDMQCPCHKEMRFIGLIFLQRYYLEGIARNWFAVLHFTFLRAGLFLYNAGIIESG